MPSGPAGGDAAVERLITLMARLPGLGPRSARRAVLSLIRRREVLLEPLAAALADVAATVRDCPRCGNIATGALCAICADERRATGEICVVESVADLWALERGGLYGGRYHVLGGVLSALDGVRPEDLNLASLAERAAAPEVEEVILALPATVDGAATSHYVADRLRGTRVKVTSIARGVPVGGELDYLDDGTLAAALQSRREG